MGIEVSTWGLWERAQTGLLGLVGCGLEQTPPPGDWAGKGGGSRGGEGRGPAPCAREAWEELQDCPDRPQGGPSVLLRRPQNCEKHPPRAVT